MKSKNVENRPIHVLQVIGAMGRGGAETMIMNLYRNIDRTCIQFDFLLSSTKRGQYEDEIESLGGKIYHIKHFTGKNPVSYYKECKAFFSAHPEIKIVHGHIGSSAALYLKAAKETGAYTIAHSHNGKPTLSLHSIIYSIYSYPTRKIADYLFGCSTEAGVARYGKKAVESVKYRNFNNGINLEQFYFNQKIRQDVRNELNISENAIVVGTVGRIAEQKNPSKLFEIFEEIVKKHQNSYCLWIGTGPEEEQIKSMVREKKLEDHILLLGERSDVYRILQAFDCFVFPSLWEGLPVTIIEAQAAGLPIVLSNRISKEVEITPLNTWLDINQTSKEWADICFRKSVEFSNKRAQYIELVKKSGYDITETSKWLLDFYFTVFNQIEEKNNNEGNKNEY